MSPEEAVKQGNLGVALSGLQDRVRRSPAHAGDRFYLFQLLSLLGQWERAKNQLQVAGELDASLLLSVQAYTAAIDAEQTRAAVFAGSQTPPVLGEPPGWIGPLIEALRLNTLGRHDAAAELRGEALAAAPAIAGSVNGIAFEWLGDADLRLGPCVEMLVEGGYFWVPLERIRSLHSETPAHLHDLIWLPVQVEWVNGGRMPAFVPVRYPGSEAATDDAVRLSRATHWVELGAELSVGLGQRLFATDGDDHALLEVRELLFAQPGQAEADLSAPVASDG